MPARDLEIIRSRRRLHTAAISREPSADVYYAERAQLLAWAAADARQAAGASTAIVLTAQVL
jgi:hypothetical protein